MARDEKIIIRLTEDVKGEFQMLAEELGMTISALGSYVIGAYVREQKNKMAFQEKMISPMMQELSRMSVEKVDSGELAQFFELAAQQMKINEPNRP